MFGYKFVKKSVLEKYETDVLTLKGKVDTLENNLKIERNNERNLYGDNCKLRLEVEVLKNEIAKLKGEEKEVKKVEDKPVEKPKKETQRKRIVRKRKIDTKKASE